VSKIAYKIEDRNGIMTVVWENGAARNAGEIEVELWKRNRDLEKAASELVEAFSPKTLEKAAMAMRKLEKLEPDKTTIKVETKLTASAPDSDAQAKLKKRLEEKRREREAERNRTAAKEAEASAGGPRQGLGGRIRASLGLAGPAGKLPG
jgi:hypothetical protein